MEINDNINEKNKKERENKLKKFDVNYLHALFKEKEFLIIIMY